MLTAPRRASAFRWLLWFGVLVVVGAAMLALRARLDKAHVALAFLLIVLLGTSAGGRALGISLAVAGFLGFNWFFLPPYDTLAVAHPLDLVVLVAFLITGVVAAQLLERERRQAELASRRAEEIDRIATLGAENLNAPHAEDALDAIAAVIREAIGTDVCLIFLRRDDEPLLLAGRSPHGATAHVESGLLAYTVSRAEPAAARADGTLALLGDALDVGRGAAHSSARLADLSAVGIPLTVRGRVVGALRISSRLPFALSEDQRRVLAALSYYAALGVERVRLAAAEEQTESLRRADRLKDSLLAAVSHDLRTPLTAIKGIANEISRGGDPARAGTIEQEADRLTVLVDDLLELSQLNSGSFRSNVALNTADDVIGAAIERVEAAHGTGRIDVNVANEGGILTGLFDFGQIMRALINLLENALKYSPVTARVAIQASAGDAQLRIAIEDSGPGIPAADAGRIFEPFFRGARVSDGVRGTGLGLSIARELVAAQHGSLYYEPRTDGGSRFVIELPAGAPPTG